MSPLPRLLISVRDGDEARRAVAGGCDLLDLKEPARGSLGMVDPSAAEQIAGAIEAVPLSMALGELSDWLDADDVPLLPRRLKYVKLGLAGMSRRDDWRRDWLAARERWERQPDFSAGWIAVVYADFADALSPPPEEIVAAAIETGCAGVLFDTFIKRGRTLLDELPASRLRSLLKTLRGAGQLTALAGSLRVADLPAVVDLAPDVIAVRRAVCGGANRTGAISSAAIAEFRSGLVAAAWQPTTPIG